VDGIRTALVVTLVLGFGVLCLVPAVGGTGGNARVLTGGVGSWPPLARWTLVTAGGFGLSVWWLCRLMIGHRS
jgi:hypothetical protein